MKDAENALMHFFKVLIYDFVKGVGTLHLLACKHDIK